jgi:hypothetical protein
MRRRCDRVVQAVGGKYLKNSRIYSDIPENGHETLNAPMEIHFAVSSGYLSPVVTSVLRCRHLGIS